MRWVRIIKSIKVALGNKEHIHEQQSESRPQGHKNNAMLNSADHEIFPANKC